MVDSEYDREYYEYRYAGKINRVPREPFLAVLRDMGVEQIKLEPP
jgi:hypothetical protein